MKKAIICHGISESLDYANKQIMPSCAKNFLPWLQQKYLLHGVCCQNPAFPNSWVPDRSYNDDVNVFSRLEIDEDTRLVGHSCGAGFLLKYLSQHPDIKVRHLVLVAPFLDPTGLLKNYYSDLQLDPDLPKRIGRIDLFYSTNDLQVIQTSVKKIIETYPNINIHNCGEMGHFRETEIGTKEFPRLWEICKSEI